MSTLTATSSSSAKTTTMSNTVNSSASPTTSACSLASTRSSVKDVVTSISAEQTVYVTRDQRPTGSPAPSNSGSDEPMRQGHSLPTAAIIGGALEGAILLTVIAIATFFCLRKKKEMVYLSPQYPSPLIGNGMSRQLHGV
ncbi:hypothetical protein J1614_002307 [Plenodomus biglobosus]|nr:hypothetical protein J1614_002307 [Plenodomus biglobosus]